MSPLTPISDTGLLIYRDEAKKLIDAFWPGPLTLILKKAAHIPAAVAGGQDSIGLRCPSHPVAQALLRAFKGGKGGIAALRPTVSGTSVQPGQSMSGKNSVTTPVWQPFWKVAKVRLESNRRFWIYHALKLLALYCFVPEKSIPCRSLKSSGECRKCLMPPRRGLPVRWLPIMHP